MMYCLAEIILAANGSGEESTFLMQMLALVILAGLVGVGSVIKTRADRFKKRHRQYYPNRVRSRYAQSRWKIKPLQKLKNKCTRVFSGTAQAKAIVGEPALGFDGTNTANLAKPINQSAKERTLTGGMELLEVGFLVRTVENTKRNDKNDVMLRKFAFNELVRRERLNTADSNALKVYALNERNLYGKDIQYEAMRELAERTGHRKM
jgi:hypothetical protein